MHEIIVKGIKLKVGVTFLPNNAGMRSDTGYKNYIDKIDR